MAKAKKAVPKKKAAVKKKTTKPLILGKGGGKGGILPLSGKPVKKAAPKKKAAVKKKAAPKKKTAVKKAAKAKPLKLGAGKANGG